MSLKKESMQIFEDYGLNEEEVRVLLAYLGNPQATPSMIAGLLEMDYQAVKQITDKLEQAGLIKKIEGVVPRYIPLEPYFNLFIKQSEEFRNEIEKIKDRVLKDQDDRYKALESIQNNSLNEIDEAVKNQIDEFFRVSDEHDANKQMVIENANNRFTNEAKRLESDLHQNIETDYAELEKDIKELDAETAQLWDQHSTKFSQDNNNLNATLDQIADAHINQTKNLEQSLHSIIDNLNANLKQIADGFVQKYDDGIQSAKNGINSIIADLLKDFAERVSNLETEIKKQLDDHVDKHKENATELKPTLEKILAKYMDRMQKVIDDLKRRITKLLMEHADHVKSTTQKMETQLKDVVDNRQDQLVNQVKSFEDNTLLLIENLSDISSKLSDLGEILAKRGSAFKALFLGRHKRWVALREEIAERVTKLSGNMKDDFTSSTSEYITETNNTKNQFKQEIENILQTENDSLKQQTDDLDKKAQQTVNAELEALATDLSSEIDNTLKTNIQHCKDTTVKLKDSTESTLKTHKDDYDVAINRHNKTIIDHYDDCNRDVKTKVDAWYSEMDANHVKAKNSITAETDSQINAINKHRQDTKDKNDQHSKIFANDTEETKKKQNTLYTNRLQKIRSDFNQSKEKTTNMIHKEIDLFSKECKETDDKLHAMLEDHKSKYQENALTLQKSLTKTITENITNVRDAIADFTLQFINSIDEGNDIAQNNEEKISDIFKAANDAADVHKTKTWHIVGMPAIIEYIADALSRVKSSVIVVTHEVNPKILEIMSTAAYNKRTARFMYTTHWTPEYEQIITKMKSLGNIQFRQLKTTGGFIAMTREAEEVLLAPVTANKEDIVAIVSTEDGYCKLYSNIIGPVFQANSRPI
ncbi:MAG: helix-turn-helix domain-containing protein [Promethearchaeota archaeon]